MAVLRAFAPRLTAGRSGSLPACQAVLACRLPGSFPAFRFPDPHKRAV